VLEDEYTLYVYTDGSTYYHPRKSGVGILFKYSDETGEEKIYELDNAGYKGGTVIQMEIMACTLALIEARDNSKFTKYRNVVIYSDSQFVVDNCTRAEYTWSRNKWTLRSGAPVANVPIWKEFIAAKKKLGKPVEIQKVKAHSKNIYNKKADKLAKKSARSPYNKSPQVVQVARKISKKFTEKGSVKIQGQIMWIHIIQRQYHHEHKIDKYRYEVMNSDSKYFEYVDYIYSEIYMKRNNIYKVRVNKDQDYPKIMEVLQEVNRQEWIKLD
jgi:ribonuclease HI